MHVDFKITTWERIEIDETVSEADKDEMLRKIKEGIITTSNDMFEELGDGVSCDSLQEIDEQMTVEENGGAATIEVFSDDQDDAIYTNEDGQTIPDSEQVAKLVTIVMKTRVVVDVRHNKDFMIALAIENFKAKLDNNEGVENIESVVNDIEMPYDPEFHD